MKIKEIKLYEVGCPRCKRVFKTEKKLDIQCYGCGKKFDLPKEYFK